MSQSEDMEAINDYFHRTNKVTSDATKLFDSWVAWYENLGPIDKNFTTSIYDEARNRRDAFNAANLQPKTDGLSTEQMRGEIDRRNSEGKLPSTPKPIIPTWEKVLIGIGVFLLAAIGVSTASKTATNAIAKKVL